MTDLLADPRQRTATGYRASSTVGPTLTATCRTKGVVMPRVVITHAVEDIDRWLEGKAPRAAAIESGTGSNVTDYVAADGSNKIAITADVADLAAMQGMLASPPA